MKNFEKINGYKNISESEMKELRGGFLPFLVPVGGYLIKQAFEHSDQIAAGFKHGYHPHH